MDTRIFIRIYIWKKKPTACVCIYELNEPNARRTPSTITLRMCVYNNNPNNGRCRSYVTIRGRRSGPSRTPIGFGRSVFRLTNTTLVPPRRRPSRLLGRRLFGETGAGRYRAEFAIVFDTPASRRPFAALSVRNTRTETYAPVRPLFRRFDAIKT